MYCPQCDAEYEPLIERCAACDIALVETRPAGVPGWVELVTVLITRDHSELAVAKSLLEAAGIEFFAKNEEVESLFAAGPIELQVDPEDKPEADALLHDLNERPAT